MCDYSLHVAHSIPAAKGMQLKVAAFERTLTHGLVDENGDPEVAVCLAPGCEIAFAEPVRLRRDSFLCFSWWFRWYHPTKQRVAKFVQVDLDNCCTHHDAFEFPDDKVIKIDALEVGQKIAVLQAPPLQVTPHVDTSARLVRQVESGDHDHASNSERHEPVGL